MKTNTYVKVQGEFNFKWFRKTQPILSKCNQIGPNWLCYLKFIYSEKATIFCEISNLVQSAVSGGLFGTCCEAF